MSNLSFISPDDPRLTAFALGELEGEELAAVEAALRDDPAARAAVEAIRAMAGQLEIALGAEAAADGPAGAGLVLGQAAIVQGDDLRKLDGGLGKIIKFPRMRFPQLYYLVGGLAAAAFAILVVRHDPGAYAMPKAEKKSYTRLDLQAQTAEKSAVKNELENNQVADAVAKAPFQAEDKKRDEQPVVNVALPAVQAEGAANKPAPLDVLKEGTQADDIAGKLNAGKAKHADRPVFAADSMAQEPAKQLKEMRQLSAPASAAPLRPVPSSTVLGPTSGGALAKDEEVETMSKFSVSREADNGYLKTRSGNHVRDLGAIVISPGQRGMSQGKNGELRAYIQSNNSYGALLTGQSSNQLLNGGRANTESYAYQHDNDFLGAAENPLSTFSADVDTASYANVRRFLAQGQLPPPDAVRIEELVNYFPYHYAPPPADRPNKDALLDPFAASLEVADAPWAPGHRLVRIGLKGREVSTAARAGANLVFLLDVSGSMDEPNKLPLVKESLRLLIGKLRPDDRVAIVVYAGASGLALPSTPVEKSREILEALDALTPGGSTNGAMGIQLAYDIAKANFVTGGLNRVILCTDGDFNVGVTGEGDLTRLIEEKAKSGVFLTVLGFGMGNYKDSTLEKLADKGNGNYGYIDSLREAEKMLVEQVNGTLLTIAKDVKLQVEFNPAQVASYRLIGYEDRLLKKEDFNNDTVDAGEIGAGHTVTALYEVVPTEQAKGEGREAGGTVDELKYRKPEGYDHRAAVKDTNRNDWPSRELLTLKVRFKEPAGTVSRKLEFPLTDTGARFADASADFKFAAAVAEFGMILRDSPHKGSGTLAEVRAWAEAGTDSDVGGYRGEFIGLVRQAQTLMR